MPVIIDDCERVTDNQKWHDDSCRRLASKTSAVRIEIIALSPLIPPSLFPKERIRTAQTPIPLEKYAIDGKYQTSFSKIDKCFDRTYPLSHIENNLNKSGVNFLLSLY